MSFAFDQVPEGYETRADIHFRLRVPYYKISEAIKLGKLELHLLGTRLYVKTEEAERVFKRVDLFAA